MRSLRSQGVKINHLAPIPFGPRAIPERSRTFLQPIPLQSERAGLRSLPACRPGVQLRLSNVIPSGECQAFSAPWTRLDPSPDSWLALAECLATIS
jgi:hypothetical protein